MSFQHKAISVCYPVSNPTHADFFAPLGVLFYVWQTSEVRHNKARLSLEKLTQKAAKKGHAWQSS